MALMYKKGVPPEYGNDRQYAIEFDRERGRIRFECSRAGHRYWQDFGPNAPRRRRIGSMMLERMAKYWRRENGGASGYCPRCVSEVRHGVRREHPEHTSRRGPRP